MVKFASSVFLALSAISGVAGMGSDFIGRTPKMWMFGDNGVDIYTADGSEHLKHIPPETACHVVNWRGNDRLRCDFMDVVSDGKKYVWASVSRGGDKIDVFSIDSGDLVGSFATCESAYDLDYHPLREEVWVHCSKFNEYQNSHMDVFSVNSPSVPITTRVMMHDNTPARSYGKLVLDPALGDVAWSTVYGLNEVFKIDLATRTIIENVTIVEDNPRFFGFYDMAFCPVNQHLFLRSQVCCTCGYEGADNLECGNYGSSNITIDGILREGQCGRHCVGGPADTIGVVELNTLNNTVVAQHQFVGAAPIDQPLVSPDGKHIVFFGIDGGRKIQILSPGANGEKSEISETIDFDFNTTLVDEEAVFDDFAWVNYDGNNILIVSSSAENKLAVVDMSVSPPRPDYVVYNEAAVERPRNRQVEWAENSPYVWISGPRDDTAYVVDFVDKEVVKTFENVDASKLLSVVNYEFQALADKLVYNNEQMYPTETTSTGTDTNAANTNTNTNTHTDTHTHTDTNTDTNTNTNTNTNTMTTSNTLESQAAAVESDDSGDSNVVAGVALFVSLLALTAVAVNFLLAQNENHGRREAHMSSGKSTTGDASVLPPSVA